MKLDVYKDKNGNVDRAVVSKPVWTPHIDLFYETRDLFNDYTIHSTHLDHPRWRGYKFAGVYVIYFDRKVIYIGRGKSHPDRGVVDRLVDFRGSYLYAVDTNKYRSLYQNGVYAGKRFGKEGASKITARYMLLGAGDFPSITRLTERKESILISQYVAKYGCLPEFNTDHPNIKHYPDFSHGTLCEENEETEDESTLEAFFS